MVDADTSELDRQWALKEAAKLLADGKPRNAREIAALTSSGRAWLYKPLVNNVLTREGKYLFIYDYSSLTYRLTRDAKEG